MIETSGALLVGIDGRARNFSINAASVSGTHDVLIVHNEGSHFWSARHPIVWLETAAIGPQV